MHHYYYQQIPLEGYQTYSTDQNHTPYIVTTSTYENLPINEIKSAYVTDPRVYDNNFQYNQYNTSSYQEMSTLQYKEPYTPYKVETIPYGYQTFKQVVDFKPTFVSPVEKFRSEPRLETVRYERPVVNTNSRQPDPNNLHVSGLSENVTIELLREVFSKYGKIKSVRLPKDIYTEKHRGYAFVTFEDSETLKTVIKNPPKVEGKDVKVEFAKEGPKKTGAKPQVNRFEPYAKEGYVRFSKINL